MPLEANISFNDPFRNNFNPRPLRTDIANAAASLMLVRIYSSQSLTQPDVILETDGTDFTLGNLPYFQREVRQCAQYFNADLGLRSLAVFSDLLSFSSTYEVFARRIYENLPLILDQPQSRTAVASLLDQLGKDARDRREDVLALCSELQVFEARLHENLENLQESIAEVSKKIAEEGGEIERLESKLEGLRAQASGEIASIVFSGIGIVAGAALIVVGILADIPTGGATTVVILSGIGLITASTSKLAGSAGNLVRINRDIRDTEIEISQTSIALAAAMGIEAQIAPFEESATAMAGAAGGLAESWSILGRGFEDLANDVRAARSLSDVSLITARLGQSDQEWLDIAEQTAQVRQELTSFEIGEVKDVTMLEFTDSDPVLVESPETLVA